MSNRIESQSNTLTASTDVSIQVQGSIDLPDRTVDIDNDADSPFQGDETYTVTAIKTATPGDQVEANIDAPSGNSYDVELRDSDINLKAVKSITGTSTVSFSTSGYSAGMYLLAVVDSGTAIAVFPLVVKAWDATITSSPDSIKTDQSLTVTADVTEAVNSPATKDGVALVGFTDDNASGVAYKMSETNNANEWEVTIDNPPAGDYQLHVGVQGTSGISFEIGGLSLTSTFNLIGLSTAASTLVEVASGDILKTNWSKASGGLDTDVSGQLQYSRPAVDNENVYVGGLDDRVTGHARNSGEVRWDTQRNGDLSDSTPVLHNGNVYIGDGGGAFHAINAADGTKNWTYDTGNDSSGSASAVTSSGAVFEHNGNTWVVFASNNGLVHAVTDDGSSFTKQWEYDHSAAVYSDLEFGFYEGLPWVAVTTTDGRLLVLDVTGAKTTNAGDRFIDHDASVASFGASSPLFDSSTDTLFLAGDNVTAVDIQTTVNNGDLNNLPITSIETHWQDSSYSGTAGANPVLGPDGDQLFVGADNGDVHAFNPSDGSALWGGPKNVGGTVASTPAVASDRVAVGSTDGSLYSLNKLNGDIEGSTSVGDPIRAGVQVLNNNVYVGTEAGDVVNLQNLP